MPMPLGPYFGRVRRRVRLPSSGKRKPVQHPGIRGGQFYLTPSGKVVYGQPPSGHRREGQQAPRAELGDRIVFDGPDGKPVEARVTAVGKDGVTARDGANRKYLVRHEHIRELGRALKAHELPMAASELARQGAPIAPEARFTYPDGKPRATPEQIARLRRLAEAGAPIDWRKVAKEATAEEAEALWRKYRNAALVVRLRDVPSADG